MKIAQIAPLIERVPPKKYGGTERMVSALTEELVKRGHEVTLFATGDSRTSAKLVSVYPRALREVRIKNPYGANALSLLNVGTAYERQDQFDIIHDHTGYLSLPAANIARVPVVYTIHGALSPEQKRIFESLRNPYLITISKDQAAAAAPVRLVGTVYNGLDMAEYPFSTEHDDYLLYVGRISPDKGVHHAIEVAQFTDRPLIIAAKLELTDRAYYNEYIEPFLSEQIRWVGEVDVAERNRLMSRAFAFLHPATWREPFGLTLIEAQACGCPVIGFKRGSIPEIVLDGQTGFVVSTVNDMIDAVEKVDTIDRAHCREHVLANFSATRMADGYEEIYRQILETKNGV